jgi:glycosyltransferase involved in cell wall biosynthesis
MTKYSVLIPFYNEEKILYKNTLRVYAFLLKKKIDFEIILVNDTSDDNSLKIANQLANKYPEIKVFSYSEGPSRRENLYWSFPKTSGDIIAFTDVDLAVNETHFSRLFSELINNDADLCIGSRYEPGAKYYRGIFRQIISILYHKSLQVIFNCNLSDLQCGFKAFKRKSILKILEKCGHDYSFRRGWFLDAEILLRAHKMGMKIIQIPIVWQARKRSSFNLIREIKMVPEIIRLLIEFNKTH